VCFQFSGVFSFRVPLEVMTETSLLIRIPLSESPDSFELRSSRSHNSSEFRLYGVLLPGR